MDVLHFVFCILDFALLRNTDSLAGRRHHGNHLARFASSRRSAARSAGRRASQLRQQRLEIRYVGCRQARQRSRELARWCARRRSTRNHTTRNHTTRNRTAGEPGAANHNGWSLIDDRHAATSAACIAIAGERAVETGAIEAAVGPGIAAGREEATTEQEGVAAREAEVVADEADTGESRAEARRHNNGWRHPTERPNGAHRAIARGATSSACRFDRAGDQRHKRETEEQGQETHLYSRG